MKKLTVTIIILLLYLPSCLVEAVSSVSFSVDSVACKSNRLIEVAVRAVGDKPLSAALFSFSYNSSVMEFRKATAPTGSKVVTNDSGGIVRLSYLCADGAVISPKASIFTLTFKTIAKGSSNIGFTVSDCVDADVQSMEIGVCTGGAITVSDKADDSVGKAESTTAAVAKGTASSSIGSTVANTLAEEATDTKQTTDLGKLNEIKSKENEKLVPLIVLCVSIAAASAFAAIVIYQKIIEKRNKNNSSD